MPVPLCHAGAARVNQATSERAPHEITLNATGEYPSLSQTHDFVGTPPEAPHEITLNATGEYPSLTQTHDFVGTPPAAARCW
jgi:hypothetical protein